jgi:geranylgeranyl diphosphate synthase type I
MITPTSLDRFEQELDAELRTAVGDAKSPLNDMIRFQMGWNDQMGMPTLHRSTERPHAALCLLAAEAVGGDPLQAMPAAAAVELANAFWEIHEDVRRGNPGASERPTLWWLWGNSQGINAGDGVYSLSRLTLMELRNRDVPAGTVASVLDVLDTVCLTRSEGRYRDVESDNGPDVAPEAYVDNLDASGGALTGGASRIGAMVGGAAQPVAEAFDLFGRRLGAAWRIRREVDSLWGHATGNGPSLVEALDGAATLPVLFAYARAKGSDLERLQALSRREELLTDEALAETLDLLERLGAKEYAETQIEARVADALGALEGQGFSPGLRDELAAMVHYLADGPG